MIVPTTDSLIWRNFESARDPDVFELNQLLFGNTVPPFCAQFILQTHAQEHSVKYPSAAETVDNSTYVDDILDSCDTVNCQGSTEVATATFRTCWRRRLQIEKMVIKQSFRH